MLPVLQNLNYKLQRGLSDVLSIHGVINKVTQKVFFLAIGGLLEDKLRGTVRSMTLTNVKTVPSNLFTPYREHPRSTRIVVAFPRLAFSATKRTNHAPVSFDQQAEVCQGYHTSSRNKEKLNTEIHGGGGLELAKPARKPASCHPKPCASLKNRRRNLARLAAP